METSKICKITNLACLNDWYIAVQYNRVIISLYIIFFINLLKYEKDQCGRMGKICCNISTRSLSTKIYRFVDIFCIHQRTLKQMQNSLSATKQQKQMGYFCLCSTTKQCYQKIHSNQLYFMGWETNEFRTREVGNSKQVLETKNQHIKKQWHLINICNHITQL